MGMDDGDHADIEEEGLWPLLRLSERLCNLDPMSTAVTTGNPLLFNRFEAYSRSIVAPDHRLIGLTTNVLECCFHELE